MKKVEQNNIVISDHVDLMDTLDSIATDIEKATLILDDLMTSDAVKDCRADTLTLMMGDYLNAMRKKQKLVSDFCNKADSVKTGSPEQESYKRQIITMIENADDLKFLKQIYTIIHRHFNG